MTAPLLELRNVSAHYGAIQALRDVSLYVNEGEIVTLIGANGAGKSTLLMTIFGDPKASSGQILYRQTDLTTIAPHEIASHGIAQVPEGRRIFPNMTVEENIVIGSLPIGMDHVESDSADMFTLFPRLKERRNQRAGTLSGGEQQMLAIARALMSRPQTILLDEPSLGLAPLVVRQIFEILREITQLGKTIFLVEQNAHHALNLADRGYVLVTGRIEMTGSGAELLARPEVRDAYLGQRKAKAVPA